MSNLLRIDTLNKLKKPAIIGISGFGGSGKSTFARQLAKEIHADIIGLDSFCTSNSSVDFELWNIMDFNRLKNEVLEPYVAGNKTITFGEFDWVKNEVSGSSTIAAKDYLIIEGVGLLRPELLKYFSFTIWIDCPIEVAISRGKQRDRNEYGVIQDDKWDGVWKENDLQCYKEYSPLETADFVLPYER